MKHLISILFFILSSSLCATPTIEGLFRGGENPILEDYWYVLQVDVTKVSEMVLGTEGIKQEQKLEDVNANTQRLKIIYQRKTDGTISGFHIELDANNSALINARYIKNFEEELGKSDYLERNIFYGLFFGITTGETKVISRLLKKLNTDYKSNIELLNKEKLTLLNRYKSYLAKIEKNKELEAELPSPLRPEDPAELAEVKELMKAPMYQDLGQVKLVNLGRKYYLEAALENFSATFSAERHQLQKLELTGPQGTVFFWSEEFQTFSASYSLPAVTTIKDVLENVFKVKVISFNALDPNKINFRSLERRYLNTDKFTPTDRLKFNLFL